MLGKAGAAGDVRCLEERLLRLGSTAGLSLGIAEREQELAARALVRRLRELERFEGGDVQASSFLVCQQVERTVTRAAGIASTAFKVTSGDRMMRELCKRAAGAFAVQRLERLNGLPVQPDTAGRRQVLVERVADEHVREAELRRHTRH